MGTQNSLIQIASPASLLWTANKGYINWKIMLGLWLGRYSEKCIQFPPTVPHKLRKNSIYPWVLVRFRICLDRIQALDLLYNSSHTSVLNRPLLPEALASLNPPSRKNSEYQQKNLNNIMSSCPIWIIFDFLGSACSALQFIPYTYLDQRTPS